MRCDHCGGALGRGAAWCGLCHAPVVAPVAAPVAVAEHVPMRPFAQPSAQPSVSLRPDDDGARGAGWATFLAIAAGAVANGLLWLYTRNRTVENEAAIRYTILTTLAVYATVAVIVIRRVARDGHPLRWRGAWGIVPSAAFGLLLGGGLAGFLSAGAAAAGQHGGDPRIALLVSEGDVAHIAAALLIAVVAAPIVEELLFRGLLLASLMKRGSTAALWLSAAAFSVWHLNPSALKYYAIAGAFLGLLYLKRGLSCSIAAHAGFNGTLTVVAIAYALAPGAVASTGGLTVHAPHGWHATTDRTQLLHLVGPSGGEVVALAMPPTNATLDVDELAARIAAGELRSVAQFHPRPETVRVVHLRAGDAVRVQVVADGRDGDLVMLSAHRRAYVIALASGGSPRVRADFDRMLQTLEVA